MVKMRFKHLIVLLLWVIAFQSLASKDPTAPFDIKQATSAKSKISRPALPQLQSIVCQQDCYAVLNDQLLVVGQQFRGYQITQVTQEQVIVRLGNQHWELTLLPNDSFSLDELNQP